jgi:hypothetical protein
MTSKFKFPTLQARRTGSADLSLRFARWVSWWVIGGIEIQQPTRLAIAFSIAFSDLVG